LGCRSLTRFNAASHRPRGASICAVPKKHLLEPVLDRQHCAGWPLGGWLQVTGLGDTMTKPKTWEDPAHSLDADWPPHQPITLMDLVAGARAVDWDFTTWCYVSGHDAIDPDARLMFECLLAYASRREGRAGLN
jgi:hypothetical protein